MGMTRRVSLKEIFWVFLFVGASVFIKHLLLGPPGEIEVTVENRTNEPLTGGRLLLGYAVRGAVSEPTRRFSVLDLGAPLRVIPPKTMVMTTLKGCSCADVSVSYRVGGGEPSVYLGYPSDGNDMRVTVVAANDSLRLEWSEYVHTRWTIFGK
jgi:hypothetical protein